jgi:hypothetical protein
MKEYLVHVGVYVEDDVDLTVEMIEEVLNSLPYTIDYRLHEEV